MNTRIIEIIGPPGVGKSTIYQSLCSTWKPDSQWVFSDVLLTSKPVFFSFRKWVVYHLRFLLSKKLTKTIPVDYGLRFAGQQPDLAKFCWKYISDTQFSDDEEIDKRFRSAYILFRTFCIYQAIIEKAPDKPCVIEEGFLQKSFFIRDEEEDDQLINELLNKYLRLIPLPSAIIYIDTADSKEIVKRLRGRNKVIASHQGKGDEDLQRNVEKWQHAQHIILEKLKNAGVQIVRINGNQSVRQNVSIIKELLKNMDGAREAATANIQYGAKGSLLNTFKQILFK